MDLRSGHLCHASIELLKQVFVLLLPHGKELILAFEFALDLLKICLACLQFSLESLNVCLLGLIFLLHFNFLLLSLCKIFLETSDLKVFQLI